MSNEDTAAAPAAGEALSAPKPVFYRLRLDHDQVYWGAEPVEDAEAHGNAVILDHAPDNPPGRYRWSWQEKRLEPLPPAAVKLAEEAPTYERALYELLKQTHQINAPAVPSISIDWAIAWERSFDGDANLGRHRYFRDFRGLTR